MRVVVCYKWVIDEADITVEESNRTLNFKNVKYKISEYDRNALELGAALHEAHGWELLAVTVGQGVEASVKDVLSRGPEKAYYVDDPALEDADSAVTAKVLAKVIEKIGNVDLVICGEGSSDGYSQQVGPRLAALLGYKALTYVSGLEVEGDSLKAQRKLDDGVEVVRVTGPAVITVTPDINKPRIPSLKQILAAKKKPAEPLALGDLGDNLTALAGFEVAGVSASVVERKQVRINDQGMDLKEAAAKLVKQLREEKVI
ncbi:MAG TPA: electron transfer flavoprotein subunit beta/FixA family protein [Clostridia bacterium]|nr:electron transfer flavoprotein subunit beta/FixA family protein [Clostridia bacterium]